MIVMGHKANGLLGKGSWHVFVGSGTDFSTLCGMKGRLIEGEVRTLAVDVGCVETFEREIRRFQSASYRCERCRKWLEKNKDALLAAERLGSTR